MNVDIENLRFPIGRYKQPEHFNEKLLNTAINKLEKLPSKLISATSGLSGIQLDTPYRENGWTIRQVVHHIADSHLNGYVRMKLAMTEPNPTIKPYKQEKWAELHDSVHAPIDVSLQLIESLHQRWVYFLKSLETNDFQRTFYHPESKQDQSIGLWVTIYAWHGDHHLSHITNLKNRMDWK